VARGAIRRDARPPREQGDQLPLPPLAPRGLDTSADVSWVLKADAPGRRAGYEMAYDPVQAARLETGGPDAGRRPGADADRGADAVTIAGAAFTVRVQQGDAARWAGSPPNL